MAPGSGPGDAQEIYQEACASLASPLQARQTNELLFRIIALNVRSPEMKLGDMRAQLAACKIGIERVRELVDKYSIGVLRACMSQLLNFRNSRSARQ